MNSLLSARSRMDWRMWRTLARQLSRRARSRKTRTRLATSAGRCRRASTHRASRRSLRSNSKTPKSLVLLVGPSLLLTSCLGRVAVPALTSPWVLRSTRRMPGSSSLNSRRATTSATWTGSRTSVVTSMGCWLSRWVPQFHVHISLSQPCHLRADRHPESD